MTLHIPLLDSSHAGPSTHRHKQIIPSSDVHNDLKNVVRCLRGSKRIVVVTGAGISTGADIPDFRSSTGLFNGDRAQVGRTKDLFNVKCLSSPSLLADHHALITSLASLSISANPTPFHSFLSSLSSSGRLLRCYTQNIDGLESKVGLKIGIPPAPTAKSRARPKSRSKTTTADDLIDLQLTTTPLLESEPEPEVIPLHGSIHTLSCTLCRATFPILPHLPLSPLAIPCPTCELTSTIREALSERRRKQGFLRSDVILYGEEHPQGESIGSTMEKDLKNVDCLVVVGTSLNIPGVKRLVKEMSGAVHHRSKGKGGGKVTLINDEYPRTFPSSIEGGKGIFDYWIESDIQRFTVDYLTNQSYLDNLEEGRESGPSTPKKKRTGDVVVLPPTPESIDRPRTKPGSRKASKQALNSSIQEDLATPTKRKRMEVEVVIPVSPVSMKKGKYVRRERDTTPTPISQSQSAQSG
ncbi:hypothetical protein I302_107796 [Kwoniella bestiolae CBS 10118]|uniref:Deacetylase sirtuin-type domain-containing protein n=1 Tax=Kwoniella bestiolae CBS 10118 TaxID=1296100 RepID=A0A1B9FXH9_9TREE|nr:hypothetical protein I302_06465 [Kwoniella bestiolae CBS 10118]OCF23483.1 hypothetical protein I302_06465 [Kwoniella bestiolae CBS 10118]